MQGQQGMPNMQGQQGMPNMQGMGNIAGAAMSAVGQMAPKQGVEHMSAADLLTVPTAQVLRLPDGHTVTIPFPPSPPDAPLEVNPAEIRSAAMLDHASDILGVLGGLASNKAAAKTLQSFGKSEHLPKNFVENWQKHPDNFEQFLKDHAGDPNLGKIVTLMQHDHQGAQVFKDISAEIDSSLKTYNDDVTQYEAEYAQYQQAFTDHLSLMKSEILPQLTAAGIIPAAQADQLIAHLAGNGGAIDFSQVAPDSLVQPSDGSTQGGSGMSDGGPFADTSGIVDPSQVASPDAPDQAPGQASGALGDDSTAPSGDGGSSDFLSSFMATLNADGGAPSTAAVDSGSVDSGSVDFGSVDSGSSDSDNVDWSSVGYDSAGTADDGSAPADSGAPAGDGSTTNG